MPEYPSTHFSKETNTTVNVPPPMPGSPADEAPATRRGRRSLWTALTLLGVAFAAVAWYQISLLQEMRASEGQRAEQQNTQWLTDAAGLRDRISAAERTITTTLPENLKQFGARLGGFDQRLNAGLEKARKATQDVAAALRGEMRASMESQELETEAKFRDMETQRQAEPDRAAILEDGCGFEPEADQRHHGSEQCGSQREAHAAGCDQRIQSRFVANCSARGFAFRRSQIFRIALVIALKSRTGKSPEIAPGDLSLTLRKSIPGSVAFTAGCTHRYDGKILWLKDQSMLQSVSFYAGKRLLRHDIVVTDMSKPSVAGYLIYPATGETAGSQIAAARLFATN